MFPVFLLCFLLDVAKCCLVNSSLDFNKLTIRAKSQYQTEHSFVISTCGHNSKTKYNNLMQATAL